MFLMCTLLLYTHAIDLPLSPDKKTMINQVAITEKVDVVLSPKPGFSAKGPSMLTEKEKNNRDRLAWMHWELQS